MTGSDWQVKERLDLKVGQTGIYMFRSVLLSIIYLFGTGLTFTVMCPLVFAKLLLEESWKFQPCQEESN